MAINLFALSAAFVGFVHSLAPGHWLPVVLMAKTRRWPLRKAALGAAVVASGHILLSVVLGAASAFVGVAAFAGNEERIERFGGLGLVIFGVIYAAYSYFRHSHCHGHEHHGPDPRGHRAPFLFLFSLGFSPCVAALPIFAAAGLKGAAQISLTIGAFAVGVLTSLVGSTVVVSLGLLKLDHPIFEHHGDIITGVGIAALGVILYFFPLIA